MILVDATIEEFEEGAWVADLISFEQFAGSFDFAGETWTGTMVTERQEDERWHTRVIGGANKLAAAVLDKFYDGSVSVQVAIQDICRECGETFGEAQAALSLSKLQRQRGPAYTALNSIAEAFDLMWWIGRDGTIHAKLERPVGAVAEGVKVSAATDSSVELVEPENAEIGGTYEDKPIRHIRWRLTDKRFSAQLYFLPFIFRAPVQTKYDRTYSARVDRDNGDGTIDVIADARFGVTKVKLFCGVPGAKVEVRGGEEVLLGFLGGDPQKPYCVAMAQDTTAAKKVGRVGDRVTVTIPAGSFIISVAGQATGTPNPNPVDVDGTIQEGTDRLKVGD